MIHFLSLCAHGNELIGGCVCWEQGYNIWEEMCGERSMLWIKRGLLSKKRKEKKALTVQCVLRSCHVMM